VLADARFGPKVGTAAPRIGRLPDQNGNPSDPLALAGPKGVVLMFYRSAGWCPFCQAQLIAMNDGAAAIESRGYRLVGLSYDAPAVTQAFTKRRAITYPLLSDQGSAVIDQWGLRDPQYPAGNMAYGVPRPIIFVIDPKGVIRGSLAEEAFRSRPPLAEVLKMLDGIK
jgi:peroxiredoxin